MQAPRTPIVFRDRILTSRLNASSWLVIVIMSADPAAHAVVVGAGVDRASLNGAGGSGADRADGGTLPGTLLPIDDASDRGAADRTARRTAHGSSARDAPGNVPRVSVAVGRGVL